MPTNWNDTGLVWDASSQTWPDPDTVSPVDRRKLSDIRVMLHREGRTPIDVSNRWSQLRWSTAAVGGFGSATIVLPGLEEWTRLRAYTALLRVTYGPRVLFEGEVEDITVTINGGGDKSVTMEAFGLARRLDNSCRRIWVKRDIQWEPVTFLTGVTGYGSNSLTYDPANWAAMTSGQFDPTDLSRQGLELRAWTGFISPAGSSHAFGWYAGGLDLTAILFDVTTDTGDRAYYAVRDSTDGTTWNNKAANVSTVKSSQTVALTSGAKHVRLIGARDGSNLNLHCWVQFENIRVLSATTTEDAAGGLYGGTVLRDLVGLCPDLTVGTIEDGTDFTITALERFTRSAIRSVVDEVAGYYTREWGVWESGRFDWTSPRLDEPQWIIDVADLSQLELRGTVDGLHYTTYVLFTDAATGIQMETSATSTSQTNPYAKSGDPHDGIVQAPMPMTALTATQLAARVNADKGTRPTVSGSVSIPIGRMVDHASGPSRSAHAIRAGDNIRIVGLPVTDPWLQGRDGESFFHVTRADVDASRGTVALTLEGQQNRSDVLIARLAAATRTLTG